MAQHPFCVFLQQGCLFHSCLRQLLFQKLLHDQWLSGGHPSTTGLKVRELNVVHPLRREESSAIGSFISLGGSSCMSLHGELCMNSQAQAELAPVFSGVNSGLSSTTQCFIGWRIEVPLSGVTCPMQMTNYCGSQVSWDTGLLKHLLFRKPACTASSSGHCL